MDWTTFFLFLHVLLMAFWLGADMGTYYAALLILKPDYTPSQKLVAARVLQGVDMFPRVAMALVVPTGLTIAAHRGWSSIDGVWLYLVWAAGLGWAWLVWNVHRPTAPAWGKKLHGIEDVWNWVLLALVAAGLVYSFAADDFLPENWLRLKFALFGLTIVILIVVNFLFKPFGPAFGRLITEGSNPSTEGEVARLVNRGKPWIWAIWAIVMVNTALALFKPVL